MRLTGAKIFEYARGFAARDLCVEGDRIVPESRGTAALPGCIIIPGLTDLHFHGCAGEDFSDASPAGLAKMAEYELNRGVTQICPAGMTLPEEQLTKACQNAAAHAAKGSRGADLVGINLEGPFLSREKRGAQNPAYLHEPDLGMLQRLQRAAGGLIKLVTVAPELPGALEFIRGAAELGVTVSLGHTAADYDTAAAAYRAGACQTTHLFNAMPPFNHRAPGVAGAAFDRPEGMVELICDGVHVHESVVRSVFRLFGRDRVILVSDSLRAAGMPDGVYPFGGQRIEVRGGRAAILGQPDTLAGSVSDLMQCMKNAVSFGVPLLDAVTAAAVNPAKALGIYGEYGSLDAGKRANFVVLDERLELRAVIFHGEIVSGSLREVNQYGHR